MKKYKGIIFNSVNVGLLNEELGKVVSANNIRTAVVSRKTRTECKKFIKARGISVDVVTGGQWCKISDALTAQKCMSMSGDPLEKQFMYKCLIATPAVTIIYFDL